MLYIYKESNSRSKLGLFLMCSLNFGFAKYFVFSASTLNITSCAVVGFEIQTWIFWHWTGPVSFQNHRWDFKDEGETCLRLLRQCLSARIRTSAAESGLTSVFNLWAQSCTWNWHFLDVLCPPQEEKITSPLISYLSAAYRSSSVYAAPETYRPIKTRM